MGADGEPSPSATQATLYAAAAGTGATAPAEAVAVGTAATPMRVLVVDDTALVRAGLCALVRLELGWEVVGEATNGRAAVALCGQVQPDLILMDVHMPVLDGLGATRAIRRMWPAIRVILLTADLEAVTRRAATAAGADGFVLKQVDAADILTALRALVGHPPAAAHELATAGEDNAGCAAGGSMAG